MDNRRSEVASGKVRMAEEIHSTEAYASYPDEAVVSQVTQQ